MYMLVYIPYDKDDGKWRIDREIITDLKGNQLSEHQIREREQIKAQQQTELPAVSVDIARFQGHNEHPNMGKDSNPGLGSQNGPSSLPSCCTHKSAIDASSYAKAAAGIDDIPYLETSQPRPQCNCGSSCACAFCLEHPNNSRSQDIAKRQAAHYAEQRCFDPNMWSTEFDQSLSNGMSCMGTAPQFAMFDTPNPSSLQLLDMFGPDSHVRNGYLLSYPIMAPTTTTSGISYDIARDPFDPSALRTGDDLHDADSMYMLQPLQKFETLAPSSFQLPVLDQDHDPSLPQLLDSSLWDIGDASVTSFMGSCEDSSVAEARRLEPSQSHQLWEKADNASDSLSAPKQKDQETICKEDDDIRSPTQRGDARILAQSTSVAPQFLVRMQQPYDRGVVHLSQLRLPCHDTPSCCQPLHETSYLDVGHTAAKGDTRLYTSPTLL